MARVTRIFFPEGVREVELVPFRDEEQGQVHYGERTLRILRTPG